MGSRSEHSRMRGFPGALAAGFALAAALAGPAQGFSLYPDSTVVSGGHVDVPATLQRAWRWAAQPDTGVQIQVGVEPGFAQALGVTAPEEVALVRSAVENAFAAWESPSLSFQVEFDAAVAPGASAGFEIDLFAVPGEVGADVFYGMAWVDGEFVADRLLSNGQRSDGYQITGAEIEINQDNVQFFLTIYPDLTDVAKLAALQHLIMHEIGHTIGLGHPTIDPTNFDTDLDPLNPMGIDPADPFSQLILSPNSDADCIMSGLNYGGSLASLFFTELREDEVGGRDALYPVPEPGSLPRLASVMAALALLSRRRGSFARFRS